MAASTALISSTPRAFSTKSTSLATPSFSKPQSQTLSFPKSTFTGLRLPCASRSLSRGSHSSKSFAVKASSELPLVGNVAPDFEAEAVFDQEFIKVKLSDYIGKKYVILSIGFHICLPNSLLTHCGLVQLPDEIGNMLHLRFLSLRHSRGNVPSSLGNLTCLQTLDLKDADCHSVPNVIWKMEQLRHLYLPWYYITRPKLRLSTLRNLQTLYYFSSNCCDLNDLTDLTNLRKLVIIVNSPLANLEETLKPASRTLDRIQSLSVHNLLGNDSGTEVTEILSSCRNIYKLDLNGRTVELPKILHDYANLTKITLRSCVLKDNQMKELEKLPNLRTLCVMNNTFEYKNTNTLVFFKGGFPHLECLSLFWELGAEELKVEEGALPSLCRFYIKYCWRLKTIPDGLRYVSTLKKLTVEMPSSFVSRLQVGGEDYYKIQHVPSVILTSTS